MHWFRQVIETVSTSFSKPEFERIYKKIVFLPKMEINVQSQLMDLIADQIEDYWKDLGQGIGKIER